MSRLDEGVDVRQRHLEGVIELLTFVLVVIDVGVFILLYFVMNMTVVFSYAPEDPLSEESCPQPAGLLKSESRRDCRRRHHARFSLGECHLWGMVAMERGDMICQKQWSKYLFC